MYFAYMSGNNGKRCFQLCDNTSANNRGSLTISPFNREWHPYLKENISIIQIKRNHLAVYGMYYFSIDLNIKKKKSKNIYFLDAVVLLWKYMLSCTACCSEFYLQLV